jgi:uncharacterized protein YbjQ (UPF0145 family)
MGLFGKDRDDDDQPEEAPAQSIASGAAQPSNTDSSDGALPQHALERLRSMRSGPAALFTSDLSVDELLLAREAGFEPLGLVIGSSIYHIGTQGTTWNQNQELQVLTGAMYHARELAMGRMDAEADALGADGVIGVRFDISRYEWGPHLAEFISIGTAVRAADGTSHRNRLGKPFTCDLSGQDFWKLRHAGYMPAGLVMGSCVYHVAHQGMRQMFRNVGQNVEMENYTQALYDARELAMERMQAEANQLGAAGVVGTRLVEQSHGWGSHIIEFFAIGTAIVPLEGVHEVPRPQLTVSLGATIQTRTAMYGGYGTMDTN